MGPGRAANTYSDFSLKYERTRCARSLVNAHATDTIEVHGFRERLQDNLLHMLSVSDPWVVFVLTLVLF